MKIIQSLRELPPRQTQAVIINCSTRWLTTLALVSALRHTGCPVLIVDCESTDGSQAHFRDLAHSHGLRFEWLSWPLRAHPAALNQIFSEMPAAQVLLIDSDLEILEKRVWLEMESALGAESNSYGAGFLHGPRWMGRAEGLREYSAYYAQRMWIPFVLLKVKAVKDRLTAGTRFDNRRSYVEFARFPAISRLAAYRLRLNMPRIGRSMDPAVHAGGNGEPDPRGAKYIEFDTGADMHAALLQQGYRLASLAPGFWGDVAHHHGVTRASLSGLGRRLARWSGLISDATETPEGAVLSRVQQRLSSEYGISATPGARGDFPKTGRGSTG